MTLTNSHKSLVTDLLTAMARGEEQTGDSGEDEEDESTKYVKMRVGTLRKMLDEKGLDVDGSRESMIALLKKDDEEKLVEDRWIGCEACGKYRMLPPDISAEEVEALPDEWYCKDNIWDPARSNCNAEERSAVWMVKYYERKKREEERTDQD